MQTVSLKQRLAAFPAPYRPSEIFRDFITMVTAALHNRLSPDQKTVDRLEQEYMTLVPRYGRDGMSLMAEALGQLTEEMEQAGYRDVLGELYMSEEFYNDRMGQFFTPYSVCRIMAQCTVKDRLQKRQMGKPLTVHEPASGSGATLIALAETMAEQGLNPQRDLVVEAWDLDPLVARMCFIQLTLLGIPARVVVGNTLTRKIDYVMGTPAYFLNWHAKATFKGERIIESIRSLEARSREAQSTQLQADTGQLALL